MKSDSVVVTVFYVSDEIFDGSWSYVDKKFKFKVALRRLQYDESFWFLRSFGALYRFWFCCGRVAFGVDVFRRTAAKGQ